MSKNQYFYFEKGIKQPLDPVPAHIYPKKSLFTKKIG